MLLKLRLHFPLVNNPQQPLLPLIQLAVDLLHSELLERRLHHRSSLRLGLVNNNNNNSRRRHFRLEWVLHRTMLYLRRLAQLDLVILCPCLVSNNNNSRHLVCNPPPPCPCLEPSSNNYNNSQLLICLLVNNSSNRHNLSLDLVSLLQ